MDCTTYHIPVLLNETIQGLDIQPDGTYVDLTYGGGGHSREILSHLGANGRLYGFDQDLDAMSGALKDDRFLFVRSNFRFLKNWMMYYKVEQVDGILADLGVSSHHLDEGERGFSFRYDAPLDMRMNQKSKLTARMVVEEYSEEDLANVLYLYGELKNSRKLASIIVKARAAQSIRTTGELANILKPLMGFNREKKDLARVFQALRIEVNGEMKALQQMLEAAIEVLKPGGRLVILTYHSLEDRMVKNMMRSGNVAGKDETDIYGRSQSLLRPVNRNVITPTEEEQASNPRSRSAKLRIAEKIGEDE
ncbi:MAG: 16S rRNA (cytosine(1402)-N(4))-methyltransferase RsmH [Bacteroidaceae bacterium]|nr:16S rRNA (cytosine(1402)-N(4))-methyltransferase RsmH [Bacteroidaceae bacterium]